VNVEFTELGNEERARLESLAAPCEPTPADKKPAAYGRAKRRADVSAPLERPPVVKWAAQREGSREVPSALRLHSRPTISSDRRSNQRLKVPAQVELVETETPRRTTALLGNLGRSGCFVETNVMVAVGTHLKIVITRQKESFEAQARVVHSILGLGVGVLFVAVAPESLGTLDAWLKNSMEASWFESNRRKNQRLSLTIPVYVSGHGRDGANFREETRTVRISRDGGLILLSTNVVKGQRLTLSNPGTGAQMECIVVHASNRSGQKYEIGLSFAMPSKAFWGVAFPPADWSPRHADAKR
jgi:hypothetical protein